MTAKVEKAAADLDSMWLDVAMGRGPQEWLDSVPDDVHAATAAKMPEGATDRSFMVSLKDEATIVFTATARVA